MNDNSILSKLKITYENFSLSHDHAHLKRENVFLPMKNKNKWKNSWLCVSILLVGSFVFLAPRSKSNFDHCLRKFPSLSAREHAQVHSQSVLPFDRLRRFCLFTSPVTTQAEEPNLGRLVWSTHVEVGGTDNIFRQSKRGIVTVGKLGISCSTTRLPEFLFF